MAEDVANWGGVKSLHSRRRGSGHCKGSSDTGRRGLFRLSLMWLSLIWQSLAPHMASAAQDGGTCQAPAEDAVTVARRLAGQMREAATRIHGSVTWAKQHGDAARLRCLEAQRAPAARHCAAAEACLAALVAANEADPAERDRRLREMRVLQQKMMTVEETAQSCVPRDGGPRSEGAPGSPPRSR